jgi:hypothetical protein
MKMFKFVCAQPDEDGNEIPNSGCGEVDYIYLDLYQYLDRAGDGYEISLKDDGTVFLTEEQKECLPARLSKSHIIEMVKERLDRVDVGACPHCEKDVYVWRCS